MNQRISLFLFIIYFIYLSYSAIDELKPLRDVFVY